MIKLLSWNIDLLGCHLKLFKCDSQTERSGYTLHHFNLLNGHITLLNDQQYSVLQLMRGRMIQKR